MKGYIKAFDTTSEYNAFKNSAEFVRPNVSLCRDSGGVQYNPLHEYVEIGGLKWATMNIGASAVTDAGLYFQWGDINGYTAEQIANGDKIFYGTSYKYCNGKKYAEASDMTKYNSSDNKTQLELSDDSARANWGGSWRMPTTQEFLMLGNAVNSEWVTDYQGSGVNGLLCVDKTDTSKTLFLPAVGTADGGNVNSYGSFVKYLSSTVNVNNLQYARSANFHETLTSWQNSATRWAGIVIRPVMD